MKNVLCIILLHIYFGNLCYSQKNKITTNNNNKATLLFQNQAPLSIRLNFSIKNIKKNTNDSTYLSSNLYYKNNVAAWDSLPIKLRARGNSRRKKCYYVPLKLKLKKQLTKGTDFEGNKKLKVVLPCLLGPHNNDLVVKEYMAYKLFEIISQVHIKTRLINIELIEDKVGRIKDHNLVGILLEDIDNVSKRLNGNEIKRRIWPLQQDDLASIRYCFFQFLIANTDFSTKYGHNSKLIFVDNKIVPVPYDFDMSGLVDASYAVVSNVQNLELEISNVTQRTYKGYKRHDALFEEIRRELINHKFKIFELVDGLEKYFQSQNQFSKSKDFISDFFEIIEDDKRYEKQIVNRARVN